MVVNGQLQRVERTYREQLQLKLRPKLPTKKASQIIRATELRAQVLEKLYLRTNSTIIALIDSMERAELGGETIVCSMLRKIYNANSTYSQKGTISTFSISRMPTQKEAEKAGKIIKRIKDAYYLGSKNKKLRIISPSERHVLTAFGLQAQVNLLAALYEMIQDKRYSEVSELKAIMLQESTLGKLDFSPLAEELKVYRALSLEGILRAVEELQSLQKNTLQ